MKATFSIAMAVAPSGKRLDCGRNEKDRLSEQGGAGHLDGNDLLDSNAILFGNE
jgi:hypothetical protein